MDIFSPLVSRFTRFFLLLYTLLTSIFFFHVWRLADLPQGLYVDESSIGLNAATIASSGRDEHGVRWPVYFQAFGEYKNPVYIYVAAALFRLVGVSEFTLRATSYSFFVGFLLAWVYLVHRLFPRNRSLMLYALAAAGFLPWFFSLSRIAFEVISQLTVFTAFVAALHRTYEPESGEEVPWWSPLVTGFFLGVFFYTYTTSRLLGMFVVLIVGLVYRRRRYWLRHAWSLLSAGVVLVPLLSFAWSNPEALTWRLRLVSYWYDTSLSLGEKVWQMMVYIGQYWSPMYLLYRGDTLSRHHTGYSGELFVSVGVLALLGIAALLRRASLRQPFTQFVLLFLVVSPVGAIVTWGDSSLRSLLLGFMLLLCSLYGWQYLQQLSDQNARKLILGVLACLLCVEATAYLTHYFTKYQAISARAFESGDVRGNLQQALRFSSTDIVVSRNGNAPYAHLEFYRYVLHLPKEKVYLGEPLALPGRCVLVWSYDRNVADEGQYQVQVFGDEGDSSQVKCFYR